jgi:hypothetical protein
MGAALEGVVLVQVDVVRVIEVSVYAVVLLSNLDIYYGGVSVVFERRGYRPCRSCPPCVFSTQQKEDSPPVPQVTRSYFMQQSSLSVGFAQVVFVGERPTARAGGYPEPHPCVIPRE